MDATPLPVIAEVSRLVTKVTDRITGDRSEFPLLVASVTCEVLKKFGIDAHVFYGAAAWVEVMENQSLMCAWGEHTHFWVGTQFGEVVDLNTSVSFRKRAHTNPDHQPKHSPPLLWSKEVPAFYKYVPEGIAEVELDGERDKRWFELCLKEVSEKLTEANQLLETPLEDLDFADEAILCPGRKILDDGAQNFRHYDRAILVQGLPEAPKL
jgi:hypothetical protein